MGLIIAGGGSSAQVGPRPQMDTTHSLIGWSWDPAIGLATSGANPQPGVNHLVVVKVAVYQTGTISNVVYGMNTAGVGLNAGQNYVGVYADGAGSTDLLGKSADQSTNFATANLITAALSLQAGKSLAVKAGDFVWAAFNISAATTAPKFDGILPSGPGWSRLVGEAHRFGRAAAGLTDLPATLAVRGGTNSNQTGIWVGLS